MNGVTIAGFCPMGCGETLKMIQLAGGGAVACSDVNCPYPSAAHEVLSESETEHVVTFTYEGFSILHPLRERLDHGAHLHNCLLHQYLLAQATMPVNGPGRYRAERGRSEGENIAVSGWLFTREHNT